MMNLKILIPVILLTAMLNIGDYFIKVAVQSNNKISYLLLAALFWVSAIPMCYYTLTKENLSLVGMLFAVMSLIGTTLIGIFIFNERLSITEWVGFALTIIATFLLSSKL